jgi:hypothetical protein
MPELAQLLGARPRAELAPAPFQWKSARPR